MEKREGVADIKILQVTNFFKPSWESGGPARVAYEISKQLIKNHKVTVFTTDGFKWRINIKKNTPIDVDGIESYYFRNLSLYLVNKGLLTPYYAFIVVSKELKNFDIIHIHECSVLGFIVCYFAKKYKIPYVVQAHGCIPFLMDKNRNILGRIINSHFERPLIYSSSKVIALTKTEAEQYKNIGVDEKRIEIVPNGINLSEYEHLPEKGKFKIKYSIRSDEKIILYLGRLNKTKGIDLLIKSFENISKTFNNVKLVLIGPDDGYQSELKKQVKLLKLNNNVLFIGYVTNDDKITALIDADVFVTPRFSGFPVTFLESCACGTPVIITTNGDELDWINDKVGYVVAYDKDKMSESIIKILTDDKLNKRFRREGRHLMIEQFGWNRIIENVEQIYEEIVNS